MEWWYFVAGVFVAGPITFISVGLWTNMVHRDIAASSEVALEEYRAKCEKEEFGRWVELSNRMLANGEIEVQYIQEKLDMLEYPLPVQQWREMELTFYAFRERLQGKPQRYLDADEDAPPPSAKFMAKLEARLNPPSTKSNTG